MVLFGHARFLTGVIAAQSQIMPVKVKASPKLGGVKKTRHGHNFEFSDPKRIAGVVIPISYLGYSFRIRKLKIVVVSFFLAPHFAEKKLKDDPITPL